MISELNAGNKEASEAVTINNWKLCTRWLRKKYQDADPNLWICISGFRGKEQVHYANQVRNLHYAVEAAFNHNEYKWDMYYGVGLGAERPPQYHRFKTEDIVYFPFAYLDIDCGKTKTPANQPVALQAIQNMPDGMKPTWINSSGNGFHIYYPIKNPNIRNEGERKILQTVSFRLQDRIKGYFMKHYGWEFDNVSDLARVDRLPLSINWKDKNGKTGGIIK